MATTFDQLNFQVKTGETVYVTVENEQERKAIIMDLSASSLIVSMRGARSELTEDRVTRIRQRVPDSLWNGALIGFVVAAAGMTAAVKALESPKGSCTGGCVAGAALGYGGLGALVGVAIDALRKGKKTIYESDPPTVDVVARSILRQGTTGVRVGIRF